MRHNPIAVEGTDLLGPAVLTALFSALSGLLPAARAARLAPVEALRYE